MATYTRNGFELTTCKRCGGFIPDDAVKAGQTWAAADGSDRTVSVESAGEWVEYSWVVDGKKYTHSKLNIAFQCRYCLVVDTPEVPEGLE